jgi:hypothetical protein
MEKNETSTQLLEHTMKFIKTDNLTHQPMTFQSRIAYPTIVFYTRKRTLKTEKKNSSKNFLSAKFHRTVLMTKKEFNKEIASLIEIYDKFEDYSVWNTETRKKLAEHIFFAGCGQNMVNQLNDGRLKESELAIYLPKS